MKKITRLLLVICFIQIQMISFSQIYFAKDPKTKINDASNIAYRKGLDLPVYIKLQAGKEINFANWQPWVSKTLKLSEDMSFVLQNKQVDQKGDIHYRYNQTYNGIPIFGSTYIVHTSNNKVYSYNGKIIPSLNISSTPSISEQAALSFVLAKFNATLYKWQIPGEEIMLKKITGNNEATYYPKGELYYVPETFLPAGRKGDFKSHNYKLAYRFDIYAAKPLKREYVFIDAITGEIIFSLNRIQTTDVPGTAVTKYSGTQAFVTDSTGVGSYRLRETGRGNGIETYNLHADTAHASAVDFTDTDNYWNNVNTAQDEVATDAHWGAEKTYDYYKIKFNRNSIDDNGFKLLSYVHYDVGYNNAFWDSQCMTYGDGDGSQYSPFTALDICGHEISHGLDEKTANLAYQNEPGAMNEGFSDIFGTCIEWFAKPATANWTMGEDIGSAFRDMSNPKSHGQPDTYLGVNWDSIQQEVHKNDGVLDYWFYLIAHGKSGTNDNGVAYNVTGISLDSAAAIAFRTLTVYLTPSSDYADARYYSILSAMDLFGPCTPEVETVADAWYAVGVGGAYNSTVTSDFIANPTVLCSAPATVHFTNLSNGSNQFVWDFGDSTTSTNTSPDHIYNNLGTYTVSLIALGGACGTDTIIKTNYISIDTANPCITVMPASGTGDTQTACSGILYDNGGTGNYLDNTISRITIAPVGAMNVTLNFASFSMEQGYDYLYVYNGTNTSSPLIGKYTGSTLPNGGTITSSYEAITLVQTSDEAVNNTGFVINWECAHATTHPTTDFTVNDTLSCTGEVIFTDISSQGPTTWLWNFGDGDTSSFRNPTHTYISNGTYTVKLVTSNDFGYDSLTKTSYITINKPIDPTGFPATRCNSGSVTLTATGSSLYYWYNTPSGGVPIYTGSIFTTPVLDTTTTYYVQSAESQAAQYVGPVDNTISNTGNYYTGSNYRYEIFTTYVPLTLNSVKVYANTAGNRTIELRNSSSTVLLDTTINIPTGESRVILNFDLPVGTNLQLGTAGQNNLYRNSNGASFPYTLDGLISITGTNSPQPTSYFYFYDWEIENTGCLSNRIPVAANILLPSVQVTPSGNINICNGQNVTLTSQAADSYLWSPGGQTTQSISVNAAGNYTVQITDDTCSAGSLPVVITVTSAIPVASFGYINNDPEISFKDSSIAALYYHWDFGDGDTSALQSPTHTYTANGTYMVMLIVTNVCGSDTITMPVNINTAGIGSLDNNNIIFVFPNPSKGLLYLNIQTTIISDINFRIYNIIGNTIKSGTFKPTGNKSKMLINLDNASKGIYMLHLWNNTLNTTRKIIIN